MRYIVVLLFLCLANFIDVSPVSATDSAEISDSRTKVSDSAHINGKQSVETEQPQNDKRPAVDNVFSGYPKFFVIPRGVCEIKEPVMVIRE